MANQPPAGRWMRMATLRPMSNPTQDPPSPQPPAPRPVLGRAFPAVPFRPAVPTAPTPVAAPPRQVTPTLPSVTAVRPASVRPAAGTNGIPPPPPPQGAPSTTSLSNGIPSPQRANTASASNGVPPPQRAPNEVPTNGVPSPQGAQNAVTTNGAPLPQSPVRAPAVPMPNVKPSPQPAQPSATVIAAPSPLKPQVAPTASPVQQRSPMMAGYGAQQLLSPRVSSPPAPPTATSTNITSPISKAPYTPQFYMPKSPSQQSPPPPQPSLGYRSPAASPSAPAPRTVTFSGVQPLSSPTKSQVSPAASTPRIPSPTTSNIPDRTPPQSPKTMSVAPPPSPLHLPPPQLRSDTEQDHKIPQEPEQKSILFLQTSEKHIKHEASIPNQISPQTTKHAHPKKHPDADVTTRTIITMGGENRGALMNLTRPHPQFPGNPHKLTSPDSKLGGTESEQSSGSSKPKAKDAAAVKSFTNSNVQGVNNSIMLNSTVTHHDPGVHVAFCRKHRGHGLIRHYTDGQQS